MSLARSAARIASLALLACLAGVGGGAAQDDPVAAAIAESLSSGAPVVIDGRPLKVSDLVAFYRERGFRPAWSSESDLTGDAVSLIDAVGYSDRDGLDPALYNLDAIEARYADTSTQARAALDLLLSDAFVRFVSDLRWGRVAPKSIDPELHIYPNRSDPFALLTTSISTRAVAVAIERARPPQLSYRLLRDALHRYRGYARQGPWPTVGDGPALRLGMSDNRVPALCQRLAAGGELDGGCGASTVVDESIERGIKRFQARHGLDADGVVGPATRRKLNLPPSHWRDMIALNLERWRWLPDDLGRRHVFVNMAGFELRVVEDGRTVMDMRVIVGRPYAHTPAFSSELTHVVVNPYWHVPPRLGRVVLLPKILADPNYLTDRGFKVFPLGASAPAIDPATVDWAALDPKKPLPYLLRQDSGAMNALGRLKFELPNDLFVYLHDTPDRELFDKTVRAFSSGCIRVQRPEDLALYLLRGAPQWTAETLASAIASMATRKVTLPEPVPVHLMYMTAWVDEEESVQFRDDIYGRDARLSKALAARK